MFRGLPLVECARSEPICQAATRAGYAVPLYRVGITADARPREGEKIVAWIRAGRHSVPIPIFEKGEDKEGL